jgi:hypothetical protein
MQFLRVDFNDVLHKTVRLQVEFTVTLVTANKYYSMNFLFHPQQWKINTSCVVQGKVKVKR